MDRQESVSVWIQKICVMSVVLVSLLLPFGVMVTPVAAAGMYTVTPRVIDVDAEARDIIKRTVTIENTTNHRVSIFATVNEIDINETGDITEFRGPTQVDRTSAITSWIEVTRGEINLMPGETTDVPLTIRMNPNTQPGEYHALVGFGSGRIRTDAEDQVQAGIAPSVVVTVRVVDDKVEFMDLRGFVVDKFITSNDNSAIHYTLRNPGDTEVVPTGEIIIYDSNGREVTSVNANPELRRLKPGEEVQLDEALPVDGLIGKYKAFLNVQYGSAQTAAVYDTAFFYALPWKKLALVFGIIIIFAIAVTLYLYYRYELGADDDDDGSHTVDFKIKDTTSDAHDHDINLKANS